MRSSISINLRATGRATPWSALSRKLPPALVVAILVAVATAPVVRAQPPTVGVYFDMAGTKTSKVITTYGVNVDFFVVAKGVTSDIKSYELGLAYQLPHPSILFDSYQLYPTWGLSVCEQDWLNLCVSADPCLAVGGTGRVVLARFTLYVHSPIEDYTICLGPTGTGHGPWFVPCGSTTAVSFAAPYQGCAVLNPVNVEIPVGAATSSWGQIKALYASPGG